MQSQIVDSASQSVKPPPGRVNIVIEVNGNRIDYRLDEDKEVCEDIANELLQYLMTITGGSSDRKPSNQA